MKRTYLSPHFTLSELTKSQTALRYGVNNHPDDTAKAFMVAYCVGILEKARAHFGVPFSPSSGYRCPQLNKLIGGSTRSQHMLGQAVDFEIPHVDNYVLAKWIKDNLTFDQLILEFYVEGDPGSGWVHVSLLPENNRGEVKHTTDGINYPLGLKP